MKDQHDKLDSLGIEVLRLDSTLSPRDESVALARLSDGRPCIAYVTPERLGEPRFRARLADVKVALFVVDEAHCISQWGHDFRPAYLSLGDAVRALGRPPVLALTATAPSRVKDDILAQLGIEHASVIDIGLQRPNLRYHVFAAKSEGKKQQLLLRLIERQTGCGIIYAATVKTVDGLADFLIEHGIECGRYHGRMRARERDQVQTAFMDRGQPRLMVATNAFGLGVDKQDIRFVVHYNFPGSLESYYQEAGRGGRDGAPASCILLYQPEDKRIQSFFLGGRYPTPEQTRAVAESLIELYTASREPETLKAIAERADAPAKKARVVLSFLKEIGYADEASGGRFAPLTDRPPTIEELARATTRYAQKRAQDRARLAAMLRYSESNLCRARLIVSYFGYADAHTPTCGQCDNCLRAHKDQESRAEAGAAAALSARRMAERAAQAIPRPVPPPATERDRRAGRDRRSGRASAAPAATAIPGAVPAYGAGLSDGSPDRRALLEDALGRRRARPGRARALKIERRGKPSISASGLDKGDLVRHATWGDGEVIRIVGDTVGAFFPGHGEKLLKASFLEKIGP